MLSRLQFYTTHTAGRSPHGTHITFPEANHLAGITEQHDVLRTIGDGNIDQVIIVTQIKRNNTVGTWP